MVLRASTQYSERVVRDYLWFNLCPRRQYQRILPAVLIGLGALTAAFALVFVLTGGQLFLTLAIVMLALAIILANLLFLNPKKIYRRRHSQIQSPNSYTFFDDRFILRSDRTVDEETEIYYSDLYSAYETDDYFLLYTMRRKGCVVGKNDFSDGRAADLRSRLQALMGNRFSLLTSTD